MYDEKNTGNNLPAEIKIAAVDGDAYKFLFIAKGGGSANKSYLFQETKALLNEKTLLPWLFEKMKTLGTAALPAVPPRRRHRRNVGRVRGRDRQAGQHRTISTSCRPRARPHGHALPRSRSRGEGAGALSQQTGIGAQFGGKYFCHDVRIVRLPRHGASCPVAMAVSCSADRQALGKITARRRVPRTARDRSGALPARRGRRAPRRRRAVAHRPQPTDGRDPRRARAAIRSRPA